MVHLGLGNFFRAHQCWYGEHAADAEQWGCAAFTGRGSDALVQALTEQEGLYTLVTRAAAQDDFELISSLSSAYRASDHDAWLACFRDPGLAVVTLTVTEAGYVANADGGLDVAHAAVRADLEALRHDRRAPVRTAPARLVAGLAARRDANGGPLALVPCDNVPNNGRRAGRTVHECAALLDASLADWIAQHVAGVSTVVDRITPATTAGDSALVLQATGRNDRCPVMSEPFSEFVLSGRFPAGRPRWETAGAVLTEDLRPFEQRKLWLLNGGHSLLAYAGSIAGHDTVAGAIADDRCRSWLAQWWGAAAPHLEQPEAEIAAYEATLLERWANPRITHRLAQIAADGSQKLPIRILPVIRAERAAGRLPAGATRALAAWICHLRGHGAPVSDPRADEYVALATGPLHEAVTRVLYALDPELGEDLDVVARTVEQSIELAPGARR